MHPQQQRTNFDVKSLKMLRFERFKGITLQKDCFCSENSEMILLYEVGFVPHF